MSEYAIEWIEEEKRYCIFDDTDMPITDANKFLKEIKDKSRNDQENKAVALMLWFEFLDQALDNLHFSRVETKHIPLFRDWLKTPPQNRSMFRRLINVTPHITSGTWMQYQSRVATFYEKYVLVHYPECKISWKTKTEYSDGSVGEKYTFREKPNKTDPRSKAIPPKAFKEIRNEVTNERDALLLDFMYISGFRRGEVWNVDIRQFEYIDRSLPLFEMKIYQSTGESKDNETKTGSRSVYIPSSLAERIGGYITNERIENKNKHNHIFTAEKDVPRWGVKAGDPISGSTISAIFKRAAKAAGFGDKTVHDCRHSMITNALSLGSALKETMDQVGHKSPETTMLYRSRFKEASKQLASVYTDILSEIQD